jgi:hypothetical protein
VGVVRLAPRGFLFAGKHGGMFDFSAIPFYPYLYVMRNFIF